jgi:hypothetical protein
METTLHTALVIVLVLLITLIVYYRYRGPVKLPRDTDNSILQDSTFLVVNPWSDSTYADYFIISYAIRRGSFGYLLNLHRKPFTSMDEYRQFASKHRKAVTTIYPKYIGIIQITKFPKLRRKDLTK